VPFVLIVEEANQAEVFAKHISPIAQAARDRDVVLVSIGQNLSKLPDEVTQNTKVWVSFGCELQDEQRFAASMLRLKPEQLGVDAFPKAANPYDQGIGWCYVRAPGVPTTRVHLPLPKLKKAREVPPTYVGSPVGTPVSERVSVWSNVEELNHWRPYPLELPEPAREPEPVEPMPEWLGNDPTYESWWAQCRRTGIPSILWSPERGVWYDSRGCLEWTGTTSNPKNGSPARPRANYRRREATPYREFYRLAVGEYPEPTADHLCGNPLCCDPTHIEPCGIAENNRRDGQREKLFTIAGWVKVERQHQSAGMTKPVRVVRWEGELPQAA
jgi:hypothetical protein